MDEAQTIDCWCPLCEEKHERRVFWTGRGKPRFFCPKCSLLGVMGGMSAHKLLTDDGLGLARPKVAAK